MTKMQDMPTKDGAVVLEESQLDQVQGGSVESKYDIGDLSVLKHDLGPEKVKSSPVIKS